MTGTTLVLSSSICLKAITIFGSIHLFHKHSSFPIGTPPPSIFQSSSTFNILHRTTYFCLELPTLQLCPEKAVWHVWFSVDTLQKSNLHSRFRTCKAPYRSVWCACSHFVSSSIPADFKDAPGASVAMY